MKQKPVILWGEHRSTEILPIDIKDRLQADPEVAERVDFVEHELWRDSDYLTLLKKWETEYREFCGISDPKESLPIFMEEAWKFYNTKIEEYEKELKDKHGPFIFNFHSGFKLCEFHQCILFALSEYLNSNDRLKEVI